MGPASTMGETAWAECESVIRRFEDAWREQAHPDIGAYLNSDAPHSVRLLVELVHIDLEFRLRGGEFARVEDYLFRFAGLSEPELTLDLIAAEFALRNRHSPPAWPEEFWLRFPEYTTALRTRIPVEGGTGWFTATRPAERPGAPLSGPPVIAGYEIQGELGRGGMGVVYKARDQLLHRIVAVKTFATVPRPESCARFAREAEAIARLDHPNIVPVYEVGEWHAPDGGPAVPFFVMKWYSGGSLDAVPSGPGTNLTAHAKTVEMIARAVHHAHQRGVLHRDLKPSNILLDDAGRPHVADFGLAGRVRLDAPTVTAVVAGTPAYMAPEQARTPRHVSTAADVYGLGAILYHRLTGQAPFAAETPLATLDLVANAPPGCPSAINPSVPRDLDTICLKCLEKDPARRYASAAELADDLERWRKGLPISARPARAWELAWRRVRRHPVAAALACTTLAALVGAVAILAESNDRIRAKEKETHAAYLRECAMRYKLEESLAREQTTRNELEGTLRREQRALYLERVSSAGRLYAANQLAEAWALLDQCPEQFRGWEWRYLDSLRRAKNVVLIGHNASVTAVAFLSDGRLVSGDGHGTLRVWDTAKQTQERTWTIGDAAVYNLATHPKHNWVAVSHFDGVSVWNADTGARIANLKGARWVAFNPDGTRAATADGSVVRLWAVPDTEPKTAETEGNAWEAAGELRGHEQFVVNGSFSLDGKQLVTGSVDRTIRAWNLETREELSRRRVQTTPTGLALVVRGKVLAEAYGGSVQFTDLKTGEVRDRLEYPSVNITAVARDPEGSTVAVTGANGEVVVYDVERRAARVYRGHSGRAPAVAFGPNRQLASGGSDATVRLWDANKEPDVRTLAWVGNGVGGVAVSPDGSRVAVGPRFLSDNPEAKALVFDATTGRELHRVACWPDIEFHPTSGQLVTSRGNGATLWGANGGEVWNKSFGARKLPLVLSPANRRMAISSDGKVLAVWTPQAGRIQLLNPADGTDLGVIETGNSLVNAIAFFPGKALLAVATNDTMMVWDASSRSGVQWAEGTSGTAALAVSPNGQWLATVDGDRVVRLREAATGREVRPFVGTALRVNVLRFSPDGTRLVTGGADRTVRLWDVETGRELLSLPGVTDRVTGLAWDARNDRVYALDSAVRVWGAAER